MQAEGRAQQHELAVAGDHEGAHVAVAVAGDQALAHEHAQVAGEGRVGIVDRLVLADEAAQARRDASGPLFEGGVLQDLVRLDGPCRSREDHRDERETAEEPGHSAGAGSGPRAGAGAPTRKRRSVRERVPPSAMITAPIQIRRISGLW